MLRWTGGAGIGAKAAVGEHPSLRELRLELSSTGLSLKPEVAWLQAAQTLPALERVALQLSMAAVQGRPQGTRDAVNTARLLGVCGWLGLCKGLAHLELTLRHSLSADVVLAAVGAAIGDRLRTLTLDSACLPPTRAGTAGALLSLAGFVLPAPTWRS